MRFVIGAMILAFVSGCSSYSSIRAADNLKKGEIEVAGGVAANLDPYGAGVGSVVPVGHASVGVSDEVEAGAHYETNSLLGEVRYGILKSEEDGIAVAVGVTGGKATERGYDWTGGVRGGLEQISSSGFVAGPTLTLGRRWGAWEAYTGGKLLHPVSDQATGILTGRIGGRFHPLNNGLVLGLEGGGSFRYTGGGVYGYQVGMLEGAAYLGVTL